MTKKRLTKKIKTTFTGQMYQSLYFRVRNSRAAYVIAFPVTSGSSILCDSNSFHPGNGPGANEAAKSGVILYFIRTYQANTYIEMKNSDHIVITALNNRPFQLLLREYITTTKATALKMTFMMNGGEIVRMENVSADRVTPITKSEAYILIAPPFLFI
ncbi:hypothetical protein [Exiguobacterium sp. s146]|uniref:hypothetical protein n=1 Tax=Exiguobacterium sp. s146 TaxID=2751223 RepID=UPI001BEC480D|nr:hypothetical protein [Exiguobacterium sp. s146]